MIRNIDILLWKQDVVSLAVKRALQSYADITLFAQNHTYNGFYPDLVVITDTDVYNALQSRLGALTAYPDAKIVYIKHNIDQSVVGVSMLVGFDGLISTSVKKEDLYKIVHALAESPKSNIQPRKRSNLIIQTTKGIVSEQFTLRQLAILCLLTRHIDYKTISKLLCTTTGDVYITENVVCSRLGIQKSQLSSYAMLYKYGSVEPGFKSKTYKIEPVMRRPGYFLVPRFYEKTNK